VGGGAGHPPAEEGESYEILVKHALDLITVCEADNTIRYMSPSVKRILGYEPDEMVGVFVPGLIHPDDLEYSALEAVKILANPEHKCAPVRYRHKDGSYVYLENYFTNMLEDPNVGAIVANSRDVTDRVRAEEALKQSEQRFKLLVENAHDVIAVCESDNTIRSVSPAVRRVLGYEPEELAGVFVPTLLHPDEIESAAKIVERANRTPGASEPVTFRFRHKDGSWVHVETIFNNLLSDPAVGAIVANGRDVTERVLQREELRRLNDELGRRVDSRTA
jgi:PAS domain S-box-containing protein